MIVSIIAAMAENRVIGRDGAMPWDIPADRQRFRELTMGHPVVMGRKTFAAIGRPLPGRENIVLSHQPACRAEGCRVAATLQEALAACAGADEVFICGGEDIYRQTLAVADRIYLTVIHRECAGDTFFPSIPAEFVETERTEAGDGSPCTFILYQRKQG